QCRQFADDTDVGAGAAQHDRNPVADDIHDATEQIGPLLGRHRRKLAIGAADQDAVEAEADDPLDIARQTRMVERSVSLEWRDRNVEQTPQSRVALRDILHDLCPFRILKRCRLQPGMRRIGRSIMLSARQPDSVTTTVSLTPTVNWPKTRRATGMWNVMPGRSSVVTPV